MTFSDTPTVALNDIYASVQGEGVLAGTPMIILRLQGCDVGCVWCDTKETWDATTPSHNGRIEPILGKNNFWARISCQDIISFIRAKFPANIKYILLTGGEPTMQDLQPLVEALHYAGYKVALETSGTAKGGLGTLFDWVCVSPKLARPNPILSQVLWQADELKVVIGKMADIYDLEERLKVWKLKPNCIISLQPVSLNKKATQICVKQAMSHGWRVSLQMHQYMELP